MLRADRCFSRTTVLKTDVWIGAKREDHFLQAELLNREDALLSEAQLRVRGKGNKFRFLPLAPETVQLLEHYLHLERPNPCSAALFVSLKGRLRGARTTPAGLRSLFRHHRQTTSIKLANPLSAPV